MNYNYNVLSLLDQRSPYDLKGVRFDDKSFMFWKKKNDQSLNKILVIFNKKYESMPVMDGSIVVSLKGLYNYRDLKAALQIFQQIMGNNKINVTFVVGNENEKQVAEALGRELGLLYKVENAEQIISTMQEDMVKKNDSNLQAGDGRIIEKYDNGVLKQITVEDGAVYENNGYLNTEEEKASLLREWLNDPVKRDELSRMSIQDRDKLLTDAVLSSRKKYRLEEADEQVARDNVGAIAIDSANGEKSLVNAELGIVQNKNSDENHYLAVEQHGDNVKVVNADVQNVQISANGVSNNVSNANNGDYSYSVEEIKEEEQKRSEEEAVFYVSPEREIYNSNGKPIGMLGEGYTIDYEDNTLLRNGEKLGVIGDYKNMEVSRNNVYSKPIVRTLKKPEQDKRAGMVSLPVIIFILSALMLIGSSILLFLVD